MMDDIYDLANRIQSLVFVPEYDDGKATVVSYTLFDEIISDNIVTATFQVTPAELAQALAAQEANVTAKVITVATRAAEGPAFTANKQDGSLTIVANNKVPGYVDVPVFVCSYHTKVTHKVDQIVGIDPVFKNFDLQYS